MSEYFSFKLVTPEKIYLEGQAELITVPGVEGDIGFLYQHTNFITSIRPVSYTHLTLPTKRIV